MAAGIRARAQVRARRKCKEWARMSDKFIGGPQNSAAGAIVREFPHLMLREIYEQPQAIRETIQRNVEGDVIFPSALQPIESALFAFKKIIIAASGSSRNAGLAGEIMMEDLAGVAVDVEYA